MSKPFSKKAVIARMLLLLPLLMLCVYLFNNKLVAKPVSKEISNFTEVTVIPFTDQSPGTLIVSIKDDAFIVNGKKTNLKRFAKTLDAATSTWSSSNFDEVQIEVTGFNGDEELRRRLNREFRKTSFSKRSAIANLIPPAPPRPPKAPKAHKPNKASKPPKAHKMAKKRKEHREHQIVIVRGKEGDTNDEEEIELILDGEKVSMEELEELKEDGKKVRIIVESDRNNPEGKPRFDHKRNLIRKMENADFYLNDKKISREEAEKINKDNIITVDVKKVNGEKSEIRINTEE